MEKTSCPICLEAVVNTDEFIVLDSCRHSLHQGCIQQQVCKGFPDAGQRLVFSFLDCPLCRSRLSHHSLSSSMKPFLELEEKILKLGRSRWALLHPDQDDLDDKLVMDELSFYMCHKCREPYFGGLVSCEVQREYSVKASELICASCSSSGCEACHVHGTEFMDFKCRFCCTSIAMFLCGGGVRFCQDCHHEGFHATAKSCPGDHRCIFYGTHPSNAENGKQEFALGCAACAGSVRAIIS